MEQKQSSSGRGSTSWPRAFWIVAIVAILVGAGTYLLKSILDAPGEIVGLGREAVRDVTRLAEAFRRGTVTTTFISYATEISGSNYLQFATLKQMEVFERTDSQSAFWGYLELPDVVVQARAPVEYTYYLDLNGRWEMRLAGNEVLVTAPHIQFNTPAIDASAIRYDVRAGSALRDEQKVLDTLRAGLMEMSRQRAKNNIPLVRELGRRKTEEFIGNWLVQAFEDADRYHVEVRFADEATRSTEGVDPVR